jgi:AcrR family transcriptional regulator
MADTVRDRILEATYACIARKGMAKTTVEDAARGAGVSRATVYRHFAGGKEQLIADTVAWDAARFLQRMARATADAPDFQTLLEQALTCAHRAVAEHAVLQKVLETEPDTLLSRLTVGSDRLARLIKAWLSPHLEAAQLQPGVSVERAGDYLARMMLSYIGAEGSWDLTDHDQVAALVRTEFLSGVLRQD